MKATIEVNKLKIRARHGVFDQERKIGNLFEISLRLVYPPALVAVSSDNVEDTLNYAHAVDIVKQVMLEPSNLIEHVAGRIHNALTDAYPDIESGSITIAKCAPPVPTEMESASFTLDF